MSEIVSNETEKLPDLEPRLLNLMECDGLANSSLVVEPKPIDLSDRAASTYLSHRYGGMFSRDRSERENTFVGELSLKTDWSINDYLPLISAHADYPFTEAELLPFRTALGFQSFPVPMVVKFDDIFPRAEEIYNKAFLPRGIDPKNQGYIDLSDYRIYERRLGNKPVSALLAMLGVQAGTIPETLKLGAYDADYLRHLRTGLAMVVSQDYVNIWDYYMGESQFMEDYFEQIANLMLDSAALYFRDSARKAKELELFDFEVLPLEVLKDAGATVYYSFVPYLLSMYLHHYSPANFPQLIPEGKLFLPNTLRIKLSEIWVFARNSIESAIKSGELTPEEGIQFWNEEIKRIYERPARNISLYYKQNPKLMIKSMGPVAPADFPTAYGYRERLRKYGRKGSRLNVLNKVSKPKRHWPLKD